MCHDGRKARAIDRRRLVFGGLQVSPKQFLQLSPRSLPAQSKASGSVTIRALRKVMLIQADGGGIFMRALVTKSTVG